jgi:hypothetical protein
MPEGVKADAGIVVADGVACFACLAFRFWDGIAYERERCAVKR